MRASKFEVHIFPFFSSSEKKIKRMAIYFVNTFLQTTLELLRAPVTARATRVTAASVKGR